MADKQKERIHPKWSYSTNIYEVNLRQYTLEGTFEAFSRSLPRLKDMGVKTLWFMPITPISITGRLGTLGSYYAVRNYCETNPEYGTLEDFRKLVTIAHEMGFKIILDFVADHTGNDHHWVSEHPEYYHYDENHELYHPHGWLDVAQLNYDVPAVREHIIEVMKFWIKECDIDGYRCDMAHLVPLDFWEQAKRKLSKYKENFFWLAECQEPEYHKVFDATYTWRWMHATEEFYHNRMDLQSLLNVLYRSDIEFPCNAMRLYFTANHDENSWNGTEYEKYGAAAQLFAVFSCTWDGIPLIYSGQELPNQKRLKFFEKDVIEWGERFELHNFYKTLLTLHSHNKALRASDPAVLTQIISHPDDHQIFSYLRKHEKDQVLVVLNCSPNGIDFEVKNVRGVFRNVFGGDDINFDTDKFVYVSDWGYLVFEKVLMLSEE